MTVASETGRASEKARKCARLHERAKAAARSSLSAPRATIISASSGQRSLQRSCLIPGRAHPDVSLWKSAWLIGVESRWFVISSSPKAGHASHVSPGGELSNQQIRFTTQPSVGSRPWREGPTFPEGERQTPFRDPGGLTTSRLMPLVSPRPFSDPRWLARSGPSWKIGRFRSVCRPEALAPDRTSAARPSLLPSVLPAGAHQRSRGRHRCFS